jgi:predicted P-loop ATPase
VHLAECMLINLDELENLSKSEIGSLKSLITQGTINIRRPYARSNEKLPRRASFAGSINSRQFLNDATGSRRFLCADVLSIDNEHVIIDPDLVLSQAFSLFKQGYQYWFDLTETEEINSNNCQYQVVSAEEEALLLVFQPARQNEVGSLFLTTTEIAGQIRVHHLIGSDAGCIQRLGKALAKNKFCRGKKASQIYKYWLLPQGTTIPLPPPNATH